jgi:hypothetical protein
VDEPIDAMAKQESNGTGFEAQRGGLAARLRGWSRRRALAPLGGAEKSIHLDRLK